LPRPQPIVAHPPVNQTANQRFPRQLRLTRAREFEQVLRRPDARLKAGPLRLNLVFNRMHHARLGLIVGKKAVARASARNRIKRVIRDRFRKAQNELPAVDLVVRVVGPVDRAHLHRHLDRLLAELETVADTARP
jgi:ribonuclease P protein component